MAGALCAVKTVKVMIMRTIDISHTLGGGTPAYPGDPPLKLEMIRSPESDGYTQFLLTTCMHTGTHVDMPMHLIDDSRMACDFPAERFIGEGVLLDVRGQAEITMEARYERLVTEGSAVLLYTGYDAHFGTGEYFSAHPSVSIGLAEFLASRRVKLLGMDMPSPDHMPYTVHKYLLQNDVLLLENLTNLRLLEGAGRFEVIALPLRLEAEASPVRAVCRLLHG